MPRALARKRQADAAPLARVRVPVEQAATHEAVDQHGGSGRGHTQMGGHVRQRRAGPPMDQAQGPKLRHGGEAPAPEPHLGANHAHHDGDDLHDITRALVRGRAA
jgi:hypothetical protein